MNWEGKRSIVVISACMNACGLPELVCQDVEVTTDEHAEGVHYTLAEALLERAGYEEPYVHFCEFEAPDFLLHALRKPTNSSVA